MNHLMIIKKALSLLGALTILVTLSFSTAHAQSKDSLRCSRIAQEYVRKEIKSKSITYKKMFVKACYDVSNVVTLVGVRTLLVEDG